MKKIFAATVSAFTKKDHLDIESMSRVIDRIINAGANGVFIIGTMGEWSQFTSTERDLMIRECSKVMGDRGELLVGISSTGLKTTLENLERSSKYDFAAHVVMLPGLRMSQVEPVEYIRTLMDVSDRPVYYYHAPANNGIQLSEAEFEEIIEHPRCAGIKNSSGDMAVRQRLLRLKSKRNFALLEGHEWSIAEALFSGCDGAVCGIGALAPKIIVDISRNIDDGDFDAAKKLQQILAEIFTAIYGTKSWIGQKYALARLGVLTSAHCRIQPEKQLSDVHREAIDKCLEKYSSILA